MILIRLLCWNGALLVLVYSLLKERSRNKRQIPRSRIYLSALSLVVLLHYITLLLPLCYPFSSTLIDRIHVFLSFDSFLILTTAMMLESFKGRQLRLLMPALMSLNLSVMAWMFFKRAELSVEELRILALILETPLLFISIHIYRRPVKASLRRMAGLTILLYPMGFTEWILGSYFNLYKTALPQGLISLSIYSLLISIILHKTHNKDGINQTLNWNLTAREEDVLRYLLKGFSNGEIGEELHISKRTVERHLCSIYDKSGLTGRYELFHYFG